MFYIQDSLLPIMQRIFRRFKYKMPVIQLSHGRPLKYQTLDEMLRAAELETADPNKFHPRRLWAENWPGIRANIKDGILPDQLVDYISKATCT
jgi:hypothetical protein